MNYVIIGNSAAAVGGIEGIRRVDREGLITIVGEEPYHVYGRPLISYLLEGKTDAERMKYRPGDFYEKNGCELKKGVAAVKIDAKKKTVALENGEVMPYGRLLIATGARPFVPRIRGLEKYEYHTFMTLGDALKLKAKTDAVKNAKVLIFGAGLIGLKCAEAIYKRVSEITVVDMADRVLPSILDAESSALIKAHLESRGIKFLLSADVSPDDFQFDILCVCTGVTPETAVAKDAGLEIGRGIFIDKNSRTGDPYIYAAGDCTESFSAVTGRRGVTPILPNAYIQGETAGINMAGGSAEYDGAMPMNAIGFFGKHILTAGIYEGEEIKRGSFAAASASDLSSVSACTLKKLFVKDGGLKGFIFIDDFKRAGIYTALVRERRDISGLDADALIENAGLNFYPKEFRDEVLKRRESRQGIYAGENLL
ncbi:MAG: FAD-dependent oxidoreductase [Clostridiales bacterium]|jgi:NAD(P)H-nitrite reductase large subunit|nr:FAD-dependent oxidoreductase [Clostridiales bacterium]